MDLSFKTPEELQHIFGARLKSLRLNRNASQREVASKAGLSLRSIRNLEHGEGSSVETLLRVLKALDATQVIEALAPTPKISPLSMLKNTRKPERARRRLQTENKSDEH